MAKKVLIVEQSLAVRGIAESLLRQNGYDVVAADSAEAAREILDDTKTDLLLVASDISTAEGQPLYESIGGSAGPMLVLHDPSTGEELPFPSEVIINKPFTPRDFLNSVAAFTGGSTGEQADGAATPFSGSDVEEDIIDAALGLDKVEIDESEVIGNDTGVFRIQNKKTVTESMIGYEHKEPSDDTTGITTRKKIDHINVPAEGTAAPAEQPAPPEEQPAPPAEQPAPPEKPPAPPAEQPPEPKTEEETAEFLGHDSSKLPTGQSGHMTESSKIEIVTDQYGIAQPEEIAEQADDGTHDYDWFINELKKEGDDAEPVPEDSGGIQLTDNADSLHPSAPAPASATPTDTPIVEEPKPETPAPNEAVDKFISEFKKEMEKISADGEPDVPITTIAPPETTRQAKPSLDWDEAIDKLDGEDAQAQAFSKEFADSLAEAVARRIVSMLDEERLYQIIREVLETSLKK
jgi:hypothetical protein